MLGVWSQRASEQYVTIQQSMTRIVDSTQCLGNIPNGLNLGHSMVNDIYIGGQ